MDNICFAIKAWIKMLINGKARTQTGVVLGKPVTRNKKYKLNAEDIKQLITPMGGCLATDRITVDGLPVRYMYRKEPINNIDSGWCFFSGTEDQAYIDDLSNSAVYDVNTIANHDPSIIQYLDLPIGVELEKDDNENRFYLLPG